MIGFYTSGQFIELALLPSFSHGCSPCLSWHVDLVEEERERPEVTRNDVATVLGRHKLWGIYLGQFWLTSTRWFFVTWFPPTSLIYRGMDYLTSSRQ
ncbi:hypothetical protein [Rhodococcus koreensis]|uniref:hypothetical protein n=1 Tax=Rhodococcus koreensis TaxID=99653 RepID=UPI00366D31DC